MQSITRNEYIVLKLLFKNGKLNLEKIKELGNLDHVAAVKSVENLEKIGCVKKKETVHIIYSLTKEGKKGLPEIKLLEILDEKGQVEIKDLDLEAKNAAVGWSAKNGLIKVENGKISITEKGKEVLKDKSKYALYSILEKVGKGELKGKRIKELEILKKRGLVEERKIKEEVVEITEKGKEVFRKIKESDVKNIVTRLTPKMLETGEWKKYTFKAYNVKDPVKRVYPGKKHPYRSLLEDVKKKLIAMGFKEMKGPLIELEFWNFDALFQPQNHPARTWTDTYRLKNPSKGEIKNKEILQNVKETHENGWKTGSKGWQYKWSEEIARQLMPRAQTTAVSARTLANKPQIPGMYFAIGRCYRPDVLDATHLIEFNQVEGIVLDENITFRNLLHILKQFAEEIAEAEKVKFYPDYYPFTEPSVQISAKHPEFGWLELGGAGIFREEVTKPLGIDVPVIAWGLGIDRLAMMKFGIKDIRYLFSYDLEWLRKAKITML